MTDMQHRHRRHSRELPQGATPPHPPSADAVFEALSFPGRAEAARPYTERFLNVRLLPVDDPGFRKASYEMKMKTRSQRAKRWRQQESASLREWRERSTRVRRRLHGIDSEVESAVRGWLSEHFYLTDRRVLAFHDLQNSFSPSTVEYKELDAISCFPRTLTKHPGVDTLFEVKLSLSRNRGQKQRVQKHARRALEAKQEIASVLSPYARSALIMVVPNYKLERVSDPSMIILDLDASFPRSKFRELQEGPRPPVLLIGFEDLFEHCSKRGSPFSRTPAEIFTAHDHLVGAERIHQRLLQARRKR